MMKFQGDCRITGSSHMYKIAAAVPMFPGFSCSAQNDIKSFRFVGRHLVFLRSDGSGDAHVES